jgi:tripartite-type tricarboxylate transporter receptor subunit TctC
VRCDSGSWAGRRPRLGGHVTGRGPRGRCLPPEGVDVAYPLIKRLQRAIAVISNDPAFVKTLADAGVEPKRVTGAQMAAAIQRELKVTKRLVKAKNITLD